MSYLVKLVDRAKFSAPIAEAMGVLREATDTMYIKGEYLGFFVNRATKRFLADPDYTQNSFNSAHFNESKKKALINAADSMAAMICRSDPISSAGELNYGLSAVIWGFLGSAEGFETASYGLAAYVMGILERVRSTVSTANTGSQKDMTMMFRRYLVIHGVLSDVISSTQERFNRQIAMRAGDPGFDEKTNQHRMLDIWHEGKLVLNEDQFPSNKGAVRGAKS